MLPYFNIPLLSTKHLTHSTFNKTVYQVALDMLKSLIFAYELMEWEDLG